LTPASLPTPAQIPASTPLVQEKSIAVLLFENLSLDPDNIFFIPMGFRRKFARIWRKSQMSNPRQSPQILDFFWHSGMLNTRSHFQEENGGPVVEQ